MAQRWSRGSKIFPAYVKAKAMKSRIHGMQINDLGSWVDNEDVIVYPINDLAEMFLTSNERFVIY